MAVSRVNGGRGGRVAVVDGVLSSIRFCWSVGVVFIGFLVLPRLRCYPCYLENNLQLDWGSERKACDAIDQATRILLFSKDVL